jgi:NADH pyrophosphatase NudC (nudix superfamily)
MPRLPIAYCPQCTKPLERQLHGDRERLLCPDRTGCGYVHWDNPLPVVAAIVEHEGEVLLARNAGWPEGWFALITGFLERGETPDSGVLRELKEETGLDGEIVQFVGPYSFFERNELLLVYHVRATGRIQLNEELIEYKKLPAAEVRPWPRGTGVAVRDWLAQRGIFNEDLDFRLPRRPDPA